MNLSMHNETWPARGNVAYSSVYGGVIAVGLPLNAVSLWTLLRRHSLRSSNAIFMVNLALSDLLLIISLPTSMSSSSLCRLLVYFYATGSWPFSLLACVWLTMLFHINIRSSAIFITFINVDRLLAVVYPLRSRHLRIPSNAWKAAAVAWLFLMAVNIPENVNFTRWLRHCKASNCFFFPQCPYKSSVSFYFQSMLVFTLLVVNVVSTTMVSWTLHRHVSESLRLEDKVNAMLIFVVSLIVFTIFFLPLSIVCLVEKWEHALKPVFCLASVNCCLDPLLYYFSLDAFWRKKEDECELNRAAAMETTNRMHNVFELKC